ncbi:MAG: acetolactate synthase small subunit [Peptococcaceae bacterium]|nr:acetolactate synthase small subunit [Peptococcaceae bacterium]
MKHTFAVLVENRPGVLSKVAGLFSRRGFNIESLVVASTENKTISKMTILVDGDARVLEQVSKQLNKLVDVIKVNDITYEETVDRQLALIRVACEPAIRTEVMQLMDIYRCKIVDVGRKSLMIEAVGDEAKIQAILKSLEVYGITELVCTGKVAMVRGAK